MVIAILVLSVVLTLTCPVVISAPVDRFVELHKGDVLTQAELQARTRDAEQSLKAIKKLATTPLLLSLTRKRLGIYVMVLTMCAIGGVALFRRRLRRFHIPVALVPLVVPISIGLLLLLL